MIRRCMADGGVTRQYPIRLNQHFTKRTERFFSFRTNDIKTQSQRPVKPTFTAVFSVKQTHLNSADKRKSKEPILQL